MWQTSMRQLQRAAGHAVKAVKDASRTTVASQMSASSSRTTMALASRSASAGSNFSSSLSSSSAFRAFRMETSKVCGLVYMAYRNTFRDHLLARCPGLLHLRSHASSIRDLGADLSCIVKKVANVGSMRFDAATLLMQYTRIQADVRDWIDGVLCRVCAFSHVCMPHVAMRMGCQGPTFFSNASATATALQVHQYCCRNEAPMLHSGSILDVHV